MTNNKLFRDQYDDEEVLCVFRKHPVVMRKGLILFMFAILLGTVPSFIKPELSYFYAGIGGGVILGLLVWMPSWIYWYYSIFIITDKRFVQITQKGFFKRSFSDIGIKQIQSVNYQVVGVQETLLGFGTMMVQTYLGDIIIHNLHHPEKTTKEFSLILREHGNVHEEIDDSQRVSHEK